MDAFAIRAIVCTIPWSLWGPEVAIVREVGNSSVTTSLNAQPIQHFNQVGVSWQRRSQLASGYAAPKSARLSMEIIPF
jgi:hypothetical protein